jgi:hypothetical protein
MFTRLFTANGDSSLCYTILHVGIAVSVVVLAISIFTQPSYILAK